MHAPACPNGPGCSVPDGLCHCGCGARPSISKVTDRGGQRVKGLPYVYVQGHHRRVGCAPSVLVNDDGCWIWQWALDRRGYGLRHDKGTWKLRLAHRAIYELVIGPIPEGFELDHLCNVPRCVKPTHLEPVTRQENQRRIRTRRHQSRNPELFLTIGPAVLTPIGL